MAPPRRRRANISRPSRPSAPPGRTPTSGAAQTRANISRARTSKADIARDLDAARGRKEFFSSRPDVSDDRAARRMKQADELQRFKNLYTKPVYTDTGSRVTGVTQMKLDAPRTLEQERQRLVQQYGPTTREVMGDIGFGLGSLAQGVGQAAQQYLGSGGVFGLAVNAFRGLSDTVNQKRQQLGEKITALTDIQKEKVSNPTKYKLSMSRDPELQDIAITEREQMTAKQQADLIKQNLERVSTPVVSKVTDDSFRRTPATGITSAPRVFDNRFVRMPGSGYQAGAGIPTLVNQRELGLLDVINPFDGVPTGMALGEYFYPEMYDIQKFKDTLPEGSTIPEMINMKAEGGSVDSKLAEMQKSTNNIYGTGILSVR
tara:strand:+ start:1129 stop:2250 length:1122 start_codon:yes stop_codon:yes gene_type:complete